MILAKYDKYKDSGVEWMGDIPKSWRLKSVKNVAWINSKSLTEKTPKEYCFKYIDIGNVNQNGIIDEPEDINFIDAPSRARRIVKHNDVIISTVRTYLKAVAFLKNIPNNTIVSTGFAVLTHKKNIEPNYLAYFIQSELFVDSVIRNSIGVSYPAINSSTLSSLLMFSPPISEQISIAAFLNLKISSIDRKVSLLEQKITHYQQLRKSLINEIVCSGLDKTVKLKDSCIEWIGWIPEHWEVKRGKDLFKEISKKGYPNEPLLAASQKMGVVLKIMLEQRSMEAQKDFENFKLVQVGDFVISLRSFEGGIETAYYKGIISPVYSVFSFVKKMDIDYFRHLFKSGFFILYLQSIITGIRDGQSIKFVEIQNTFFAIPPIEEQSAIAAFLDEKTQKIDNIVSKTKTQIDTLKELRKTLINDVVTGKIKVTN